MNILRKLRKKKGLSQQTLANILNVSVKSVSAWETGRRYPRHHMMQKIEDYFGVSKESIFFGAFNYKK
ncbi:helix-turn-helix transcriptional regulator [Fructilactobacillus vespulae]|uniref:helix-turn-helix transcriptional regulator n=1 Tax=Fructilactobacillus vespulae TaxID=1249630 RepID=UPI0039B379FF